MRDPSGTEEDSAAYVVPRAPWRVTSVSVPEYPILEVTFVDGTAGRVIINPSFMHGVFSSLRDPAFFSQVHVMLGAVTWPGDLDLAPDAMYDAIVVEGEWVLSV